MNASESEPDIASRARRSVIVTGAASGIGRAAAQAFAAGGDRVLAADLDAAGVEETVRRITAAGGVARVVVGDLAEQRVVDAVVARAVAEFGGVDVLVNSEAGLRGGAAGAAYTAAKHGITGLVKNLAVMYRAQGIRANMIAPGPTATGMGVDSRPGAHGPSVVGSLIGASIGRIGSADEQAAAIVWLASGAASFVNGAVLPVDDGWSAV